MYKLSRLIYWLSFCFIAVLNSCTAGTKTPEKYKNSIFLADSSYAKDSLYFSNQIMSLIEKKESAFYPKSYDHLVSKVYIDSIVYSPDTLKAAFFVIIKNSNSSLLVSDNPDGFHYNAKCFLAWRDNLSSDWNLKWFRIMNINRYSKYEAVSGQIRKRYFEDLNKIKNEEGQSMYRYNLNDIRFWKSSAWSEKSQMLEQNFSGDGG